MVRRPLTALFMAIACSLFGRNDAIASEAFVIGVSEVNYLPHSAVIDGIYVGFAREVFDAFAADQDLTPEYTPFPRRRQMRALFEGDVDFIYPDDFFWQYTEKLGRSVIYSEPVARYVHGVSVQPNRLGQDLQDVRKLAILSGAIPYPFRVRIAQNEIEISENPDLAPLLLQAMRGRVDGVFADASVVQWRLENKLNKPGELVFDRSLPYLAGTYHLSTINRTDLLTVFNTWLRDNATRVDRIRDRRNLYHGLPADIIAGG